MSRKRPAPGADTQPAMYSQNIGQPLSDDQFLQWGQSAQVPNPQGYQDASVYGANPSNFAANNNQPSNQLTRRPPMSQVVTRPRYESASVQPWVEEPNSATESAWADDINDLELKAQAAKKDAQAKRKQIPPFVQKLNSFLEDGKNTDLIRWSDNGNSFVVLDEDEFAKTLIPELFKHNNYASFVRQLNMYGFHKKVGLSDNSMRASERKNKTPSEYSNPYFRRGHPDLLWLIQKPKNATGKKGKKDADQNDDDVEDYVDEAQQQQPTRPRPPPLKQLGDGDSTLSQEQLSSIHQELSQIRNQQVAISKMMGALKREQEQLYGQAATYQEQHNRHENSINAILTFLATIYNRSIQGHEGSQNIQNLFSGAIPHESQGTVVDVGEYNFDGLNGVDGGQPKPFKKPPLLLTDGNQGRTSTVSPSSTNSPFPPRQTRRNTQQVRNAPSPQAGNVEELFDSAANTPSAQPQDARYSSAQPDFMSVINNANARNSNAGATPPSDFSTVLNNLENAGGQSPLTNSQRADMLRMMHNSSRQGGDNALINSTPPSGPSNFDRQLARSNADLDQLAKLQAEQDKSVQNLTNLLQPLSPSGSIPGIHDNTSLPPPPLDIDDFLNHNEYFTDFPSDGAGSYDFTGTGDADGAQQNFNLADYNDSDELFGDLPPTNPEAQQQNGRSPEAYGFDAADDGTGRVESLASSEATTPNANLNEDVDGVRTRSARKGRKLSSADEAPYKRRRS